MDRDIEQAADLTTMADVLSRDCGCEPAGRDDATQPDPAIDLSGFHLAVREVLVKTDSDSYDVAATAVLDLVGPLIVPATAEHIAEAIEAEIDLPHNQRDDFVGVAGRGGLARGAEIARSFAAGLSAGATGGDSDG